MWSWTSRFFARALSNLSLCILAPSAKRHWQSTAPLSGGGLPNGEIVHLNQPLQQANAAPLPPAGVYAERHDRQPRPRRPGSVFLQKAAAFLTKLRLFVTYFSIWNYFTFGQLDNPLLSVFIPFHLHVQNDRFGYIVIYPQTETLAVYRTIRTVV
ncbi:hypothetical protein A6764_00795 [Brevibacillus sp. WF146]|nr:hypothetical protein [Brevibacillus sp. WF146]UYZ13564.1 hypothetical protein A6764_00795 [Brevibacillus sp. WF146]